MNIMNGRVCLITGASKGLGRHFAHALAKAGATVVVSSLKSEMSRLENVVSEIKNFGAVSMGIEIDVTEPHLFEEKIAEITKATKKIDVLINNAGISYYTNFFDIQEEDWNIHFDINLKGAFFYRRLLLSKWLKIALQAALLTSVR